MSIPLENVRYTEPLYLPGTVGSGNSKIHNILVHMSVRVAERKRNRRRVSITVTVSVLSVYS